MALAQKQEDDLHTPATHYEILSERLKNVRIDRLEEKLTTCIDATRIELLTEIKSTNTRIDSLEKIMSKWFTILTIVMAFVGIGLTLLQVSGK